MGGDWFHISASSTNIGWLAPDQRLRVELRLQQLSLGFEPIGFDGVVFCPVSVHSRR